MIFLGLTAHLVFTTVSVALLLARGVHSTERSFKHGTSSPWLPSGPPPTKLPTEAPEALQKVLPLVSFDCKGKTGYFPDAKFNCEVFHYCKPDGTRNTFLCPPHSLFNQLSMVCEETSPLNSRICKEGSISAKKESKEAKKTYKSNAKFASKKKYGEDFSRLHRIKPAPALNNTRSNFENRKTFEELLNYGHHKPAFYFEDGFSYDGDLVKLPKSTKKSSETPPPTTPTTRRTTVAISGQPNNSKFSKLASISIDREILQPSESALDDVSVEYDAIEGRKSRKHKRVGRVLDIGEAPRSSHKGKRQTHSHVSARSATENPPEDSTRSPTQSTTSTTARITTLPSLFSADRTKVKDFRKRRRNLNRRRKIQKTNDTTTETTELLDTTTTTQSTFTTKEDSRERPKFDYTRRRLNGTRKNFYRKENSQSWHGIPQSGKVEPYTLPPLPMPEDEVLETTTNTIGKEDPSQLKKKLPEKDGRAKNTWYKTTPIPADDLIEMKFGEKISDLYHQHYHTNIRPEQDKSEQKEEQEFQQKSFVSKELVHDEYNDKYLSQDVSSNNEKNVKGKYRNGKQISHIEDDVYHLPHSDSKKRQPTKIEDLFPPPRAEPREHKSLQQQETQTIYTSVEKPNATSSEERTTERPMITTKVYRYRTKTPKPQEEGQRWRLNKDRKRTKGRKIEVGSTFSKHTESPESDFQAMQQIPTTTQLPATISVQHRKELPKTTSLAHQHLLKLMNEFFAMSSPIVKDQMGKASETIEAATSNSRVSDGDMILESESTTDEVGELPPEVLEVVDMLVAGQSDEDKKEYKSDSNHEIIKISGPLTNEHLKQIISGDVFEADSRPKKKKKETVKKIVFLNQEEKDDMEEESEKISKFTSLKLQPFLKQLASEKTAMTVLPVTQNSPRRRKPTVLTAKKIPVRVIYKDQLSDSSVQRKMPKSNLQIIRSQLPSPSLQVIQKGRTAPTRTYSQPYPKQSQRFLHSRQALVLHPQSLYPPHPPPLPKKSVPFKIGFPFVNGNRPMSNLRYVSHRRKRSVLNRDRRQVRHNPRFFPFPRPVFPTFNPKFVPNFPPFRNMFPPNGMNSASSNVNPFSFPRFEAPKPNIGVPPPIYKPPNSPPAPVRHITQHGDQTVIVEEVPVPIHVEVSDPNFLRPVHSGSEPKNHLNPYPSNRFRSPSPPSIRQSPLLQGFQGRFPVSNNYRPYSMPSNARPPVLNFQPPSVQFSQPLPPSITDHQGQVFALGVTNQPFVPGKPPPVPGRFPNAVPGITGKPPLRPFQHFDVHASSYPNFPYFQGAFTTPLTIEPVPGRLMYSGYKPPKPTEGTKVLRTTSIPNKKVTHHVDQSNRRPQSRPKPTQAYYNPRTPIQEQRINYYAPNVPIENSYMNQPGPHLNSISPSQTGEQVPRRRRPSRKRRPRPRTTTATPTVHISKDISPTPAPPEQIPPPPATYTSVPLNQAQPNSLQSAQESAKVVETSSHYPPAGYYGKDQLGQFFDLSSKSYNKASTPKPYEHNDLGESTSSAETEESVASVSSEDPDQPAFGTRLKSKPRGSGRRRKSQPVQSPTERTETRTRPNSIRNETQNKNKRIPETSSNRPSRNRERDENQRRQRVLQHRSRSAATRQPEVRHFNSPNGFYSVPSGLHNLVAPERPSLSGGRTTDMFGIPHPSMDQNVFSIRPEGAAGDFNSNFFSVPAEVAKQQQSPLLSMNIKPIPESAREFFEEAAKESTKVKENSEKKEKEEAEQKNESRNSTEEAKPQRNPAVRKVRKPKRKNRYNPKNEEKQNPGATGEKTQTIQEIRNSLSKERTTTQATTTLEPRPAYIPTTTNSPPQNDNKEPSPVFRQRNPLLPKNLPDLSKSLLNGKIDIKKLNATISTSVSVSGAFPKQANNTTSSEENSSKKVFSSQNGGLSVTRSNPRKRKQKQRQSTFPEDEDSKTKYDIAASVLDIIKATTETEKNGAAFYSTRVDKSQTSSPKSSTS